MPQRKRIFFRAVLPLGLLAMAAAILGRRPDDWEYETADEEEAVVVAPAATERQAAPRRRPAGRFALAATFSTLFFAGAAFTAGAGDQAARLLDEDAAALEAAQPLGNVRRARDRARPRCRAGSRSGGSCSRGRRPRGARTRRGCCRVDARRGAGGRGRPLSRGSSTRTGRGGRSVGRGHGGRRGCRRIRALGSARTEQRRPRFRGQPLGPAGGCLAARSGRQAGAHEEVGRQARGRATRESARDRDRARRRAHDLAQPRPTGSDTGLGPTQARLRETARRDFEGTWGRLGRRARGPSGPGRARRGARFRAGARRARRPDGRQGHLEGSARALGADRLRRPRGCSSQTSTGSSASRRS